MSAAAIASLVVALLIVVGCAGIVVPVLPGSALILVSVLVWAIIVGGPEAWAAFAAVAVFTCIGMGASWVITGRRLKARGVPSLSLLAGLAVGVVGFFVLPVVGLLLGFVAGLYLAEWARLGDPRRAWETSWATIRAAGLGIAVEFGCAALAAGAFGIGVWAHFA
ncbi:DUF456 family protein [Brevibacterium sp. 5221]|uniref:DUF456 family protein n=1 Tax=Brevibacterium rongguiense TaxID=2695267 RepID=A0A6N9H7W1_9MICO|nr:MULTISPECIES: DUF456 domain-containing protein [Brevibacterium]MYM19985.1 DUF456 family protein [Brevibacterium rongguiense]WAL40048.1 DUF456 domain-containing protein [Brevibacterium sp. BRM-1]